MNRTDFCLNGLLFADVWGHIYSLVMFMEFTEYRGIVLDILQVGIKTMYFHCLKRKTPFLSLVYSVKKKLDKENNIHAV